MGLIELLDAVADRWREDPETLIETAEQAVKLIAPMKQSSAPEPDALLIERAVDAYIQSFDQRYGGFGNAPKFPTPHNLLFLLRYYELKGDAATKDMASITLERMYRGGLFDHISGGFSRYSVDRFYLVPHFEKMLYDNALLIMAYTKGYCVTQNPLFRAVAERTAGYVFEELRSKEGGFFCAQDADSEGVEGKFYLLTPEEVYAVLPSEEAERFCARYDITQKGNFEGKSIPNLLSYEGDDLLPKAFESLSSYRKARHSLHLDDKCLTSWNALMIAALAKLFEATGDKTYLDYAEAAAQFIDARLTKDGTLMVSYRNGHASGKGFLEDYAFYCYANLCLYNATAKHRYLARATHLCEACEELFYDKARSAYTLTGTHNETLIATTIESYDGAIPSGNSAMAVNLVWLSQLTGEDKWRQRAHAQLSFLSAQAEQYPHGHSFFLLALLAWENPPEHVVVVLAQDKTVEQVRAEIPFSSQLLLLHQPTEHYPLQNGATTYYICRNFSCLPPQNSYQ